MSASPSPGPAVSARDMTEEQRSVLSRVEKLLRLAGRNTSAEEAASAAAKAQELLLAYNLSAAALGSADEGRRGQEALAGGFYEFERDLMTRVADVNFCLHWVAREWVPRPPSDLAHARNLRKRGYHRTHFKAWRHHLVGRLVSVETCIFDRRIREGRRPVRDFADTFSAETVVMRHFFSPPAGELKRAVEAAEAEFYRTQGDMRAALEAALPFLSLPPAAEPVAVKALEWEEVVTSRSEFDPAVEIVGFEAADGFGNYYIIDIRVVDFELTRTADHGTSTHETEREAKAAAQADYEKRICSALAPSGPVPAAGEAKP